MASNRIGRINEAIREALAGLLRTVKDPRVTESMLTITHVDTTSDLRYARVYISALNCRDEKGLMKGLKSASGYLRHELGQKVDLRYTPELQFIMDDSIAHGAHILDLLNHVKPANPANADIAPPRCVRLCGTRERRHTCCITPRSPPPMRPAPPPTGRRRALHRST